MSVAAPSPDARWPRRALVALEQIGVLPLLTSLVLVSVVGRLIGGWARQSPTFFPDEYLYSELSRSLAHDGQFLVRGASTGFPSLLYPVLNAPAWLADDVVTSFWISQAIGAVAMSLAAIPAFALARYLRVGIGLSLAIAALTVAVPDLVLSGWLMSEPLAYPLALAAVWAGVRAIDEPTRSRQVLFLGIASLAVAARFQLAVVPLAFLVGALATGARERRLRGAVRELWPALAPVTVALAAGAAVGFAGGLGSYSGALQLTVDPARLAAWTASNGMVLLYASGWALIPGAGLGAVLAIARPSSRAELAFGAISVSLVAGLLLQSAFVSSTITGQIHERYVFYAVPLIGVAFALWARRGWPLPRWYALAALGLIMVSATVPLTGFAAATGKADSAFLRAFGRVEVVTGDVGLTALAFALGAALLSGLALVALLRPALGTRVLVGVALGACLIASGLASAFDAGNSAAVRRTALPAQRSWVDRAGVGPVTLLWNLGGIPADAHLHLFWNRSIGRVGLLPHALPFDGYAAEPVEIDAAGRLTIGADPVRGPVLVDDFATTFELDGATRVDSSPHMSLWAADGEPRAKLRIAGRYFDGWLAQRGDVTVWPTEGLPGVHGWLELPIAAPTGAESGSLALFSAGSGPRTFELAPGTTGVARVPACSADGPWKARFEAGPAAFSVDRLVTLETGQPAFVPDAAACTTTPRVQAPTIVTPGPTAIESRSRDSNPGHRAYKARALAS